MRLPSRERTYYEESKLEFKINSIPRLDHERFETMMICALLQVEKNYVKVAKNVYTEFSEFTRKEIKEYEKKFKR